MTAPESPQAPALSERAALAELVACKDLKDRMAALAHAVIAYDAAIRQCSNDPLSMSSFCTARGETLDTLYLTMLQHARTVVALRDLDPNHAAVQ